MSKAKSRNERNLNSRDGKWYLDFTFHGKRIRKFGGYTKEQARNTIAKIRMKAIDEETGFRKPKLEDPLFQDYTEEFLKRHYVRRRKTGVCHRQYFNMILKSDLFKGRRLSEITPATVAKYHSE